ncbi:aromatic amino acid lyase, partial [Clostridium sp.]|uniref:aromatic amino acid lyase n=1 Tax=Clostridium sp. TaxID=1506 RepID=UPI003EF0075B
MKIIQINGNELTLDEIVKVARQGYKVELTVEAENRVIKSRSIVDEIVDNNRVIYGITTGFGKFSDVTISGEDCKKLQTNLIISHACGAGDPFSNEIVKTIMLLRANALAKGYSGIRLSTLKTLIQMINSGVNPIIPEKGSLGASGDLAPLA